jgi:hypothetical protein
MNFDELVKSRSFPLSVIPAEAGIHSFQAVLDPGVRRGDDMKDFLRVHQFSEADKILTAQLSFFVNLSPCCLYITI